MNTVGEIVVSYKKPRLKLLNEVKSSFDIAHNVRILLKKTIEHYESFIVFAINKGKIIGYKIYEGGIDRCLVDQRKIFQLLINSNATNFIIAHNHPSGSLRYSEADKALTDRLKKAGEILDIQLLDSLIVTKDDHFSFWDKKLL